MKEIHLSKLQIFLKRLLKNKRLTILYALLVICILALGGIYFKDYIRGEKMDKELAKVVKDFKEKKINNNPKQITDNSENQTEKGINKEELINTDGFKVIGIIKIKAIGIEYPILDETSEKALKVSVCKIAGGNLNTPGNVALAGHNMRNGRMFAKAKLLKVGQKIELVDTLGKAVEYRINNIFTTDPENVSVLEQNVDNRTLLTLITCTSDSEHRLIIQAEAIK
jgi:LPXTG-site transpeptidase (sortase) family protein